MKILILNHSDHNGGAARASHRLYESLRIYGIDAKMLVHEKISDDKNIIGPSSKIEKGIARFRSLVDSMPARFRNPKSREPFNAAWLRSCNIIKKINKINPDIVHLHWICGGMMSIEDIALIKFPIVWSLHDMWAFSGGTHYSDNSCNRQAEDSLKNSSENRQNNLSSKIFQRKLKTYRRTKDLSIVGLSKWINECSRESILLRDKKHINIPNPINTEFFKPKEYDLRKNKWGIPTNKKIVMFGAMNATSNKRKGYSQLKKAIEIIDRNDVHYVIFGNSEDQKKDFKGQNFSYIGNIASDDELIDLYNLADIMVVPSLQENLSNSIMESLSCGTPVVCFNIGGNSDMVKHKFNGYLAEKNNIKDLSDGITWILDNLENKDFSNKARKYTIENFSYQIVAKKYIEFYEAILRKNEI